MHDLLRKKRHVFGGDAQGTALATASTLDANGVKAVMLVSSPIEVYRWGFIVSVALDAGSFVAELNKNSPIGGSDVQMDTLSTTTDRAAGDIVYVDAINEVAEAAGDDTLGGDPNGQGSVINVAPSGPISFDPGDVLEIEVTTAATAGDGYFFIEYVEHDFDTGADNVYAGT